MLAIQGIHVQEQFVREHPLHWGIGKLRSEAIEGWIGLCKQYQRHHGNYNIGWLLRLHKFLDLYTIGAVEQELIDFAAIERNHYLHQKLIYEDGITDSLQFEIERQMPDRCKYILSVIDTVKFKGQIPNELQQLIIPTVFASERMKRVMDNVVQNQKVYFISDTEGEQTDSGSSGDDYSYSSSDSKLNKRKKRKTKQQHFQDLHSQRISQFDNNNSINE